MHNRKNMFWALCSQLAITLRGLILPSLFIHTFGSSVNGLISSITQFLSFITLLEGGLGAVVLAELYRPIELHKDDDIIKILCACQRFFNLLSAVFIGYTAILAVIYPLLIKKDYGFVFTASLIIIMSLSTLIEYLFSITNKLLLQAEQKFYVVSAIQTITTVINVILTVVLIKIYPSVHLVKFGSALIYLAQPIVFSHTVEKKYQVRFSKLKKYKGYKLENQWSGFAQNLAHYINMNTDIILITIALSLADVSVYSVYMLAVNALRTIFVTINNSYQSALGKYYVEKNPDTLKTKFDKFQTLNCLLSLVLFNTCLLLINGFVSTYTKGISDASYYQPIFAIIIVLANMIYSIREPYRLLVLAAGKFKETNFGSIMEAILNFGISILLVYRFGLIGVAIGTLIAITYRLIYFLYFLRRNILYKNNLNYLYLILVCALVSIINILVYLYSPVQIQSWIDFIVKGIVTVIFEGIITGVLYIFSCKIFRKKMYLSIKDFRK